MAKPVVNEGDPEDFPQLDPGEATVLSAAAKRAAVILDERKARALIGREAALRAGIREATGIAGLILLAKRRQRIPAVRPLLDGLTSQDFRLSPSLLHDVLDQAGELEEGER